MHKTSPSTLALVAIGMMLAGNAQAQQSSPANTQRSSPPQAQSAPGANGPSASGTKSGSALSLTTQKDKISYAIGMNIGNNLRRQPLDLDPKILAQGLNDALAGGATALTPDEARTVLVQAQEEMRVEQQRKMQATAQANKQEGAAFLAANRTKPGVVALPSGLQYKVLRQGAGPKPTLSDMVLCNYSVALVNGTEIDSSYKRGHPVTIPVGKLIKGWTEALQLMPVGSKWQLFLPADLAYGDQGAGSVIGPDSTLVFNVELLSIEHPAPAKPASGAATQPSSAAPASGKTVAH